MPRVTVEPHAPVRSLEELYGIATVVAGAAGAAYSDMAARMRHTGRTDLAALFEDLAADAWRRRDRAASLYRTLTGAEPEVSSLPAGMMAIFDDEDAGRAAPERASAYAALAMAVRNAERVFAFWTYVAAHSPSEDVREAAEQIARDGLARAAALRRERRRAYHEERAAAGGSSWTPETLERRLIDLLRAEARRAASAQAARLDALAGQASDRADALKRAPLGTPPFLGHMRPEAADHCRPVAELLLDCYLELAERLPAQEGRDRAQRYAAELLDTMSQTGTLAADRAARRGV